MPTCGLLPYLLTTLTQQYSAFAPNYTGPTISHRLSHQHPADSFVNNPRSIHNTHQRQSPLPPINTPPLRPLPADVLSVQGPLSNLVAHTRCREYVSLMEGFDSTLGVYRQPCTPVSCSYEDILVLHSQEPENL